MYAKATGAYAKTSSEATSNAKEVYSYLHYRGWTVNAVAGILGNIWAESGLNPWRWQMTSKGKERVCSTKDYPWKGIGYGFFQFTPADTYIQLVGAQTNLYYGPNFSDRAGKSTDGLAQLYVIDKNLTGGYIETSAYPLSHSEFKASTSSPSYLAAAWLKNFERAGDMSQSVLEYRGSLANYFYEILTGVTPTPDPEPEPSGGEYLVTAGHKGDGEVTVSPQSANAGDKITVTVRGLNNHAYLRYEVISPVGLSLDIETLGTYTFTMPESDVFLMFYFEGSGYSPYRTLTVTLSKVANVRIEWDTQDGGTMVENISVALAKDKTVEYNYDIGITDEVRIYGNEDYDMYVSEGHVDVNTVGDGNFFFFMPDDDVHFVIEGVEKKKKKSSIYYIPWWAKYRL